MQLRALLYPTSPRTLPSRKEITANALAGVSVGIIALPLSIALAVAVGAPPIAGLYTAAFAGAVAAIFGGSGFNITGPTAALVPLLSAIVLSHGPGALPLVGLMAGGFLVVMSLLRFGRLIRYMPALVIVGFTAGIALSIAFGQVNALLAVEGTDPGAEHFHERTWDTLRHLGTVGWVTPLLGLTSLAMLVAAGRAMPKVPATLVVVVAVTAVTWGFGLDTPTIESRYGALPSGMPRPSFAFLDAGLAVELIRPAIAIAILAAVESLLSAVVADGMAAAPVRHDPDRELFGQGLANLVAPVLGGIPATAAIARTAAGIRAGATGRLTGVFHSVTVLTATLAFAGMAGHIPLTVLAAILLVVAWRIAEVPEVVRLLRRAPREDLAVLVSTVFITVFFDLTYAIGFGVVVSVVLLLRKLMAVPAAARLVPAGPQESTIPPELSVLVHSRPDLACFNAQGMLSFHSAAMFEYELMGDSRKPLVIRMQDVTHIDSTGLLTLEGLIEHHQRRGGRVVLTALRPDVFAAIARFGIIELLGPENVFQTTAEAIAAIPGPVERTPVATPLAPAPA